MYKTVPPSEEVVEYTKRDMHRIQSGIPMRGPWVVMDEDYQDEIPTGHTAVIAHDFVDEDGFGIWNVVSPWDYVGTVIPAGSVQELPNPELEVTVPHDDPHYVLGDASYDEIWDAAPAEDEVPHDYTGEDDEDPTPDDGYVDEPE